MSVNDKIRAHAERQNGKVNLTVKRGREVSWLANLDDGEVTLLLTTLEAARAAGEGCSISSDVAGGTDV